MNYIAQVFHDGMFVERMNVSALPGETGNVALEAVKNIHHIYGVGTYLVEFHADDNGREDDGDVVASHEVYVEYNIMLVGDDE